MKADRAIINVLCVTALVGAAIWLATEHRGRLRLAGENNALRQQLNQMAGLVTENERLSSLVAQVNQPSSRPNEPMPAQPLEDERLKELLRLRGEVGVLRQQAKELEALREDTRQAHAAQESSLGTQTAGSAATTDRGAASQASQLQILKAEYWTDNARLDVTGELRDRIRGDSLKVMAGNDIKGDPEFGQVKHLTVEYSFAGVAMTNDFREGEIVVIPQQ